MLENILTFGATATAETSGGALPTGGGPMGIVFTVVLWGAVMYFLLIRPQRKNAKKQKDLIEAVKEGDTVITRGGIKGEVVSKNDEFIEVRVDKGVKLTLKKEYVTQVYKSK